jgi:hypothetical protein
MSLDFSKQGKTYTQNRVLETILTPKTLWAYLLRALAWRLTPGSQHPPQAKQIA